MNKTSIIPAKAFFEKSYKKSGITEERKELLVKIATAIANEYEKEGNVSLNFICTHNSRRSQLGQVWSFFAANYFDLNIKSFSGGTEVTAFHRNTVKTLQKVGFSFRVKEFSHQNPVYTISFEGTQKTILGFSKVFSNDVNLHPYIAITTCDSADKNCPFIPDAIHRFHMPFVDPKHSDNTNEQDEVYLQTNRQIATEIYFIFNEVKKLVD